MSSYMHTQEVRYKRIYERRPANLSWTMDLMACWFNGQVIALLVHFPPILERSLRKLYYGYNWTSSDASYEAYIRQLLSDDTNDNIILKKCCVDNRYLTIKINDAVFSTRNTGTQYHDYDPPSIAQ